MILYKTIFGKPKPNPFNPKIGDDVDTSIGKLKIIDIMSISRYIYKDKKKQEFTTDCKHINRRTSNGRERYESIEHCYNATKIKYKYFRELLFEQISDYQISSQNELQINAFLENKKLLDEMDSIKSSKYIRDIPTEEYLTNFLKNFYFSNYSKNDPYPYTPQETKKNTEDSYINDRDSSYLNNYFEEICACLKYMNNSSILYILVDMDNEAYTLFDKDLNQNPNIDTKTNEEYKVVYTVTNGAYKAEKIYKNGAPVNTENTGGKSKRKKSQKLKRSKTRKKNLKLLRMK